MKIKLIGTIDEALVNDVIQKIESNQDQEKIDLIINSAGGSVIDGMKLLTVIKNSSIPINATIDQIAFSMAAVIAMECDKVKMMDDALLMFHDVFGGTDEEYMTKQSEAFYSKVQNKVTNFEEFKNNAKVEKKYTAKEALDMGLIDSIMMYGYADETKKKKTMLDYIANFIYVNFGVGKDLDFLNEKSLINLEDEDETDDESHSDKMNKVINQDMTELENLKEEMAKLKAELEEKAEKLKAFEEKEEEVKAKEVKAEAEEFVNSFSFLKNKDIWVNKYIESKELTIEALNDLKNTLDEEVKEYKNVFDPSKVDVNKFKSQEDKEVHDALVSLRLRK